MDSVKRGAWVEINLGNLKHNINKIRSLLSPDTDIIGVVKADAYGHGAVEVSRTLEECGISHFAVATIDEAIELRDAGIRGKILLLGLIPGEDASFLANYNLIPVIGDYEDAELISRAAVSCDKILSSLIAVDTGMGRIGFVADAPGTEDEIEKISKLDGLRLDGLFSHFATADEEDLSFSEEQISKFSKLVNSLEARGLQIKTKTFANSAAIMALPEVQYDFVRPGIIMYGVYPSDAVDKSKLDLRPVMSVKAKISQLKSVPAGFSCSYGRKFITEKPSVIATIPLGYADGYPRQYSLGGKVIVNGELKNLAGNICMDQCMADVTGVPDVKKGDEVVILGKQGDNEISADDIAKSIGTISYEILNAFGRRLPRVFV